MKILSCLSFTYPDSPRIPQQKEAQAGRDHCKMTGIHNEAMASLKCFPKNLQTKFELVTFAAVQAFDVSKICEFKTCHNSRLTSSSSYTYGFMNHKPYYLTVTKVDDGIFLFTATMKDVIAGWDSISEVLDYKKFFEAASELPLSQQEVIQLCRGKPQQNTLYFGIMRSTPVDPHCFDTWISNLPARLNAIQGHLHIGIFYINPEQLNYRNLAEKRYKTITPALGYITQLVVRYTIRHLPRVETGINDDNDEDRCEEAMPDSPDQLLGDKYPALMPMKTLAPSLEFDEHGLFNHEMIMMMFTKKRLEDLAKQKIADTTFSGCMRGTPFGKTYTSIRI